MNSRWRNAVLLGVMLISICSDSALAMSDQELAKVQERIATQYQKGIDAAIAGDNAKAKELLKSVIDHWVEGKEYWVPRIPPLAQVQIAYARVAKKSADAKLAEEIESKCKADLTALENKLKNAIAEQKKISETSERKSREYDDARFELSAKRQQLADLYLAEQSNYKQAEELLKAAFVDIATIRGRQSDYALAIASDYGRLLRATGRDPKVAEDMVAVTKFRKPLNIDLKESPAALKSGAETLRLVVEDQGWGPSGDEWCTKKAFLEGSTRGKVLWRKALPLRESVDMNGTIGAYGKGTHLVLWFTGPRRVGGKPAQEFDCSGKQARYLKSFFIP